MMQPYSVGWISNPFELLRADRCLAKLGYKQELRRNFTLIEVFGIAFSIMGLLPSIASTLSYAIPAGPVGMVWVCDGLDQIES